MFPLPKLLTILSADFQHFTAFPNSCCHNLKQHSFKNQIQFYRKLVNWAISKWWFSERDGAAIFPPPMQVRGSRPAMTNHSGFLSVRTALGKNLCWYLLCEPPWESHVKTDTCSPIALSQGSDCAWCLFV